MSNLMRHPCPRVCQREGVGDKGDQLDRGGRAATPLRQQLENRNRTPRYCTRSSETQPTSIAGHVQVGSKASPRIIELHWHMLL